MSMKKKKNTSEMSDHRQRNRLEGKVSQLTVIGGESRNVKCGINVVIYMLLLFVYRW